MSSSGSSPTTPTTKGGSEAKTEGRSRTGQGEVQAGQETVGVVIVVIRNGTEVATQGKEVTDTNTRTTDDDVLLAVREAQSRL